MQKSNIAISYILETEKLKGKVLKEKIDEFKIPK